MNYHSLGEKTLTARAPNGLINRSNFNAVCNLCRPPTCLYKVTKVVVIVMNNWICLIFLLERLRNFLAKWID